MSRTGDNLSHVPEGWAAVALGDSLAAGVQPGFACGVNNRDEIGTPHLRPMNVSIEGRIAYEEVKYVPSDRVGSDRKRLKSGDVLFNNTNSAELVGKTALYDGDEGVAFSNHMTRVRCTPAVLPKYCALALHQKWREGHFLEHCNRHVSQASIGQKVLKATVIPLPPLAEQQRIVAKVESLLSRVRSVRQRLVAVPGILRHFRQAVLAHACSGRLTEDWRERGSGGDAGELLAEIQRKRPTRYRESNSGPVKEPVLPTADDMGDHPDGWDVASLDLLTCLVTSGSRGWARYYSDDGPLFVRAQNISTDRLELDGVAHVSPPASAEGERTTIQPHDLLITITGANVTKSALVTDDIGKAYVSQHVALARPVVAELAPYLYLWIVSKRHGRAKLERDAYGAGKPGLNLTQIREMPVAVPPLAEQQEIVRRVEALFALADSIERRVEAATKRAETLTQSILARAFRGELVPTEAELARAEDREYETAEQLLSRIREETPTRMPAGRRTQRRRWPRR